MDQNISFKLNGKNVSITTDPERMLLWVLRTDLGVTGTKCGCEKGLCGACTVMLGKRAVRSCIVPMGIVKGKEVMTVEGLAKNGKLHPIQEAFAKHGAFQCGFCAPGMMLSTYDLLLKNPDPTTEDIIRYMDKGLCRCGAHIRVIRAIKTAARQMKGAM